MSSKLPGAADFWAAEALVSPRPARCADHGARGAEDTEDGTGAQDRRKRFRCGAARGRWAPQSFALSSWFEGSLALYHLSDT